MLVSYILRPLNIYFLIQILGKALSFYEIDCRLKNWATFVYDKHSDLTIDTRRTNRVLVAFAQLTSD